MSPLERLNEALLEAAGKLEVTLPVTLLEELLDNYDHNTDCDCANIGACYCGCERCMDCS